MNSKFNFQIGQIIRHFRNFLNWKFLDFSKLENQQFLRILQLKKQTKFQNYFNWENDQNYKNRNFADSHICPLI